MNSILLGTANLLIYFIIAISIAFPARLLFTIPEEVFRKILHFILLGSFIVLAVVLMPSEVFIISLKKSQ